MNRKKFLILITVFIFLIFLVNSLALRFYWYYSIWWFDMLMHFLGGFWIGLLLLYIFAIKKINYNSITQIFLGLLIVGIGWEVFEIIFRNMIQGETFYIFDTLSDISFDLAGGLFSLIYFSRKILRKGQNKL